MPPKKQPAEALHRPAGVEYFADRNAAVVLIPRQVGKGHDAVELRKNPSLNSTRPWLVRLNGYPPFSISERRLMSLTHFRKVAVRQLSAARVSDHQQWPRDIFGLSESSWCDMVERLIAALERGGAK
jgi:hypothetical protein